MKISKLLLASLLLSTAAPAAFASDADFNHEVLKSLVLGAGQITLVDETGDALKLGTDSMQLPDLFASAMTGGYTTWKAGEPVVLTSVDVSCKPRKGQADRYNCEVSIMNGDFSVAKDGGSVSGPELESAVFFTVPARKTSEGQARLLSKKFKATLAG